MMNTPPTIALCMIVKNEQEFLRQCLKSASPLVDEMIVVDTGSTDQTMNIARELGAKVFEHPWNNSFSEARNHALHYVNSDWVLQLDADEELEKEDITLARNVIQSTDCNAVFVAIYNYLPRGRSKLYFPRLFRRGKAQYEGIVHNQVVYEGKSLHSEIRIYHYGYSLSLENMTAKYERSRKLLEMQLSKDPGILFSWYNLIRIYKNQNRFDIAADQGIQIIERFQSRSTSYIYLMIIYDTVYSLMKLKKYNDAIHYCNIALKLKPDYIDVIYALGTCYFEMKEFKRAAVSFSCFIENAKKERKIPKMNHLDIETLDYIDMAFAKLGECQWHLCEKDIAKTTYRQALQEFRCRNSTPYKKVILHPEVLSTMGNICIRLNDFHKAADFFGQCLEQVPSNPYLLNNLATCYAHMGKTEAARLGYLAALNINPSFKDAKRNLHILQRINSKS